jgi:hypothetical protein
MPKKAYCSFIPSQLFQQCLPRLNLLLQLLDAIPYGIATLTRLVEGMRSLICWLLCILFDYWIGKFPKRPVTFI